MEAHSDIRGTAVLLVDNYSSFSQNLVHYLAELTGALPTVVTNDHAGALDLDAFDAVVLSPGPGSPEQVGDFGICASLLGQDKVPVLGICLGHQGLGVLNGATLTLADEPFHGRCCTIVHEGDALFAGIPEHFTATRYHSLILRDPLPDELVCTARTPDGLIMALAHRERPQWSVQFHPESIASEYGHELLANFCRLARGRRQGRGAALPTTPMSASPAPDAPIVRSWTLQSRIVAGAPSPSDVFQTLYGDSDSAFWLDGAVNQNISYVGDASGPHGYRIVYDLVTRKVAFSLGRDGKERCQSVFTYLDSMMAGNTVVGEDMPELDFVGGLVGYFGYELKGELGATNRHRSPWPDAQWLWVDRFVAFDHKRGRAVLVALTPEGEADTEARAWLRDTEKRLLPAEPRERTWAPPELQWRDSKETYERLIGRCIENITEGESYELCLTTQLQGAAEVDGLALFRRMRENNPAPYAAFLRCEGFEFASSSPERFLQIDVAGHVNSKPIKGTARRDADPIADAALAEELATSEKERAENLMIVDLVRHDLGHTCEVGSIKVSALAAIESYASVHQLVSTVSGRLASGATRLQCIAAAFPGGSMTGAPKKRSMEILDELESGPRGPYAGSIGYLSMNGAVDLSIVIRSVLVEPERVHLGVGGAITSLSDIESEVEEVALKAEKQVLALSSRA